MPRCRAWDPMNWGANAIYDIVDNKLNFAAMQMPAPQKETENCVAHDGAIIPIPGRDIFVQTWYQGGISVIYFTDSSNPIEIAYFDRGPILDDELITGGYWSVYYYEGTIYGTEITRGLDVFKLLPSEFLSENEINAAELAYPQIGSKRLFNPQQQIPMAWPANPAVALSYVDQLERMGAIDDDAKENIRSFYHHDDEISKGGNNRLSRKIRNVSLETNSENEDASKIQNLLLENLDGIAERLKRS